MHAKSVYLGPYSCSQNCILAVVIFRTFAFQFLQIMVLVRFPTLKLWPNLNCDCPLFIIYINMYIFVQISFWFKPNLKLQRAHATTTTTSRRTSERSKPLRICYSSRRHTTKPNKNPHTNKPLPRAKRSTHTHTHAPRFSRDRCK